MTPRPATGRAGLSNWLTSAINPLGGRHEETHRILFGACLDERDRVVGGRLLSARAELSDLPGERTRRTTQAGSAAAAGRAAAAGTAAPTAAATGTAAA